MADGMEQILQQATTNAQLALQPTFAINAKEDKFSSHEWLQKLMNNKTGGGWSNKQNITHLRIALRGEVLKWFNALPLMEMVDTDCDAVKAQFIIDFRAAPTSSKVIQKLPEIRQKDNEMVNQYTIRCAEILMELKDKYKWTFSSH